MNGSSSKQRRLDHLLALAYSVVADHRAVAVSDRSSEEQTSDCPEIAVQ
jgi:hypothetical protein